MMKSDATAGLHHAEKCQRLIIDYWANRGRSVDVWFDPIKAPKTVREAQIFPLASNLKNGWPEGRAS